MARPRTSQHTILPVIANMIELRKAKGWSQKELAEALGVHMTHVARLETGVYRPSIELVQQLMALFHVTADELILASKTRSQRDIDLESVNEQVRALPDEQFHQFMQTFRALFTGRQINIVINPIVVHPDQPVPYASDPGQRFTFASTTPPEDQGADKM